jgi:hypothetical protein
VKNRSKIMNRRSAMACSFLIPTMTFLDCQYHIMNCQKPPFIWILSASLSINMRCSA